MTQKGYDNLKLFVRNGGTIVFIDGNVFYAEVYTTRISTQLHYWKAMIGVKFANGETRVGIRIGTSPETLQNLI
jgi:hypothetical protein